jgi:rubrerythrin
MKNPKLEPLQVAKWMAKLSDHAFIEFFYEQLSARNISRAEERYIDSHLVLAAAKRMKDEQEWKLEVLCPTPNQKWVDDASVCQFGSHCGFTTASISKQSICPLCGEEVSGS